jgi:hypothetical protein
MVLSSLAVCNHIGIFCGYSVGYGFSVEELSMHTRVTLRFEWPKPHCRYELRKMYVVNDDVSIPPFTSEVVVPSADASESVDQFHRRACYSPFTAESGMHLEFAKAKPERETVLSFADRYGPLTTGRLAIDPDLTSKLPKPRPGLTMPSADNLSARLTNRDGDDLIGKCLARGAVRCDLLHDWFETVRKLSFLHQVHEALKKNNRRALENLIVCKEHGPFSKIESTKQFHRALDPIELERGTAGPLGIFEAARHALAEQLHRELADGVTYDIQTAKRPDAVRTFLVPRTLKHFLWMQFALSVEHHKDFKPCEVCGKEFELTPEIARTSRTLCSAACKAKAHRKRRAQALSLAAEGLTRKDIATKVGSKLETVKKWLEERENE